MLSSCFVEGDDIVVKLLFSLLKGMLDVPEVCSELLLSFLEHEVDSVRGGREDSDPLSLSCDFVEVVKLFANCIEVDEFSNKDTFPTFFREHWAERLYFEESVCFLRVS